MNRDKKFRSMIAKHILDSDLAGCLSEFNRKTLEGFASGKLDREGIYLRLETATSCGKASEVDLNIEMNHRRGGDFEDESGNFHAEACFRALVNWPSFGNMSPELSAERAGFMLRVSRLAKEIEDYFGQSFTYMLMTKEEAEARKRQGELDRFTSAVKFRLRKSRVRVSEKKHTLKDISVPTVPLNGTMNVDDKEFWVESDEAGNVAFSRTK